MQANRPVVLINDPTVLVRSMWSSTSYKIFFFFFLKKKQCAEEILGLHFLPISGDTQMEMFCHGEESSEQLYQIIQTANALIAWWDRKWDGLGLIPQQPLDIVSHPY